MLPRKRPRPSPTDASPPQAPQPAEAAPSASPSTWASPGESVAAPPKQVRRAACPSSHGGRLTSSNKQVRKAKSWYGAWPMTPASSKASPSTSVARENILGGTVRSRRPPPDLSRFEVKRPDDAASMRSTRPPSLSRVPERHEPEPEDKARESKAKAEPEDKAKDSKPEPEPAARRGDDAKTPGPEAPQPGQDTTPQPAHVLRPAASSGWLGWWSRPPGSTETAGAMGPGGEQGPDAPRAPPTADESPAGPPVAEAPVEAPAETPAEPRAPSTSWFGFLTSATALTKPDTKAQGAETAMEEAVPPSAVEEAAPPLQGQQKAQPQPAGSAWAFWSREAPKREAAGEIAVMGEGSEAHPAPVTEGDVSGLKDGTDDEPARSTWRRAKRRRPASAAETPTTADTPTTAEQKAPTTAEPPPPPPNLVLPSLAATYGLQEEPSMLQQFSNFVLRAPPPAPAHVSRLREPRRIRKAVAIGIHGFFPAAYLRPMVGQPTGTSLRFASLGAEAISRWAAAHGCGDCEVARVALEGEGRVGERVDNLWRLLLNWIDDIRRADLVLVAAHSQGVPVAVMLLDRLLGLGVAAPGARVAVCAMAGVALGPFADYRSSILVGSAAELWDFADPRSANARRFEAALGRVLEQGARVTFVGSLDDQVVPLEVGAFAPFFAPCPLFLLTPAIC